MDNPAAMPGLQQTVQQSAPQQRLSDVSSYENSMKNMQLVPRDEFEHKAMMIKHTRMPARADIFDLLTNEMVLANIKDDHLVRIYQLDFETILFWYDMGLWEEIGKQEMVRFLAELSISRANGGTERKMQGGWLPVQTASFGGIGDFFKRKQEEQYVPGPGSQGNDGTLAGMVAGRARGN